MTEEELTQIEARANAASEGPWQRGGRSWNIFTVTHHKGQHFIADCGTHIKSETDAQFIAHAREDVPALCREVRRLCKELQDVERGRNLFQSQIKDQRKDISTLRKQLASVK